MKTIGTLAPPVLLVLTCFLLTGGSNAHGAVSASGDTTMPSQNSSHPIAGNEFQVSETVAFDAASGPWLTSLVNGPDPHPSGREVTFVETLTNTGPDAWDGWHQQVRSRANLPGDVAGFLFHDSRLFVQANYGSGLLALTPGVDYTVVPTLYSGPPIQGNEFHWEAFSISFAPGREIGTGHSLRIRTDIFEVFGDGDPWRPGETAIIGQFPTVPEPARLLVGVAGALIVWIRRPRR